MTQKIDFFPTVIEDTEDGKGRETKIKGIFTADHIDPFSFKHALEISGLEAINMIPLLETGNIHAFRLQRKVYGPGDAPLHYKDSSPTQSPYEPLWPWEYRSIEPEDLKKLFFCRSEIEAITQSGKNKPSARIKKRLTKKQQMAKKLKPKWRNFALATLELKPKITITEVANRLIKNGLAYTPSGEPYKERTIKDAINDLWQEDRRKPGGYKK